MPLATFIQILIMAALLETVDSGLGMGYGTVLSPLLILAGYPPTVVVPSILLSQAVGGLTASFFHHKYGNADFRVRRHKAGPDEASKITIPLDLKISLVVIAFGITASILGALVAVRIPKDILKAYIGILVLIMGILILLKGKFAFSWRKIFALAVVSAFNKGISGGGFGPVMTGGQIISGNSPPRSIGSTTLTEAPICIVGFITFLLTKGISTYALLASLSIGALLGGVLGPLITKRINPQRLRIILGVMITAEGIAVLTQVLTGKYFGGG